MKKKKRIRDLEERVRLLEEYVNNENARRIEELRAAIKQAKLNADTKDLTPGTVSTKNPTSPFYPC